MTWFKRGWLIESAQGTICAMSKSGREAEPERFKEYANLIAEAPDLLWYLEELTEAVQTLADRHGYKLPQCLPYAKASIARAKGQ